MKRKEVKAYAVAVEPDMILEAAMKPGSEAEKRFKRINDLTEEGRYGVNIDSIEMVVYYLYDTAEHRNRACRAMVAEGINAAIVEQAAYIPAKYVDPREMI